VELSPVCPLGTNSTLDQNQTVTTIRNSEVCSDSTNVLALSVRDGDETEDAEPSIQSFVPVIGCYVQSAQSSRYISAFSSFSLVTAGVIVVPTALKQP